LTDLQFKFAMARLKGANKTQAARVAGYQGGDSPLRSQAVKVSNSAKVQAFLKWAETSGAGLPDDPCDAGELKRILSRHARGDDRNTAIRAAEVLHRINAAEIDANADQRSDPLATLRRIAEHSPELAQALAEQHGLDWTPPANGPAKPGAEANQQAVVDPSTDGPPGPFPR
jgi:hypothetical protein